MRNKLLNNFKKCIHGKKIVINKIIKEYKFLNFKEQNLEIKNNFKI